MVQQALAAATGTAAIGAARRGPAGTGERDERVSAGRSSGRTGGGMDAPSEAPAWPGDGLPASGGLPVPPVPPGGLVRDARPAVEERDLLVRLRDGDELAFARLYEQHWDAVQRLLARLTGDADLAGDVAQEVFVQLYRKPPHPEAPLRAWLCRVAVNRGYNALRSDRRRRTREDTVARDPAARDVIADPTSTEEANRTEERDAVRRVLVRLPERQRDCLALRAEGLSYAEMATALGVAPGSVGTLLARAERAFKEAYVAQRGGM